VVYSVSDGDNPRPSSGKKRPGAYEPGCADRDEIRRLSDQEQRIASLKLDLELVGIGGLSGKKGGTAPGHDWTSPSQKWRPCRHNISAGVFRQSAAYGPNSIGPYFLSVGSIIALLPFLAPVFSALAGLQNSCCGLRKNYEKTSAPLENREIDTAAPGGFKLANKMFDQALPAHADIELLRRYRLVIVRSAAVALKAWRSRRDHASGDRMLQAGLGKSRNSGR